MTEPEVRLKQGKIILDMLRRKRDRLSGLLGSHAAALEEFEEADCKFLVQVLEVELLQSKVKENVTCAPSS